MHDRTTCSTVKIDNKKSNGDDRASEMFFMCQRQLLSLLFGEVQQ